MMEKYKNLILNAHNYIWTHPETGYKEFKTSAFVEKEFQKLGYDLVRAGDIPGFYTVIDTGRPGPEILILGELDSLICPEHPDADAETGAVHCCGHSTQCAALLGVAAALKEPDALNELSGRIRLCAVPAEELIEIEYRTSLKKEGRIKYFGGKAEFLHRGYFDGVDLAFMVHASQGNSFSVDLGAVGCLAKRIEYKGVSAHAGGCPWDGCNALYAATLGISAINAIRETFMEPDIIRVHPIITKGGEAVNAIPDHVVIESYVRGSNFKAIEDANRRINRALSGAALSLGANVDINDVSGYAPLINDSGMIDVAHEAALTMPEISFEKRNSIWSASTDMGDLSCVMPVVHAYAPGASGTSHGADYKIANPELACVASAEWQLAMLKILLKDGAARAKEIIANAKPRFASKEEYFEYMNRFTASGDRIIYNEDGTATVNLRF